MFHIRFSIILPFVLRSLQANFSDIPNVLGHLGLHSLIVKSVSLKPSKSLGSEFHIFHMSQSSKQHQAHHENHMSAMFLKWFEVATQKATQSALARGVRADFFAFTQSCSFQEGKDQKIYREFVSWMSQRLKRSKASTRHQKTSSIQMCSTCSRLQSQVWQILNRSRRTVVIQTETENTQKTRRRL